MMGIFPDISLQLHFLQIVILPQKKKIISPHWRGNKGDGVTVTVWVDGGS